MRILVADDDPVSRRMLCRAVALLGHDTIEVADGDAAWAALSGADPPRIALLDWSMPGIDGIELCRRVHARGANPFIYTLLVTARSGRDDLIAGLDAGAQDFLGKPVEIDELCARLRVGERTVAIQNELARSRAVLEAVLASVDTGVVVSQPDGTVLFVNDAAGRLTGVAANELCRGTRDHLLAGQAARSTAGDAFLSACGSAGDHPVEHQIESAAAAAAQRVVLRWQVTRVALPDGDGTLDVLRDVTREEDLARELRMQATTDPLTQLLNRRGARQALDTEVSRTRRARAPLSVALLDLDHFKQLNDRHGHAAGDEVLRAVAAVVGGSFRRYDIVARWGGEEMLVALPGASVDDAMTVMERVRAKIGELRVDHLPPVTVSIGVAELLADDAGIDTAISRADGALYRAKASGRDRVEVAVAHIQRVRAVPA